jgi:hypothetical protein
MSKISCMVGKTFTHVEGCIGSDDLIFTDTDGKKYKFYHTQNCCESVYIEDIVGDLNDLIGTPMLLCEDVSSDELTPQEIEMERNGDSVQWTFYKLATIKGYVDIRWFGESNGYYSTNVDFEVY